MCYTRAEVEGWWRGFMDPPRVKLSWYTTGFPCISLNFEKGRISNIQHCNLDIIYVFSFIYLHHIIVEKTQ